MTVVSFPQLASRIVRPSPVNQSQVSESEVNTAPTKEHMKPLSPGSQTYNCRPDTQTKCGNCGTKSHHLLICDLRILSVFTHGRLGHEPLLHARQIRGECVPRLHFAANNPVVLGSNTKNLQGNSRRKFQGFNT